MICATEKISWKATLWQLILLQIGHIVIYNQIGGFAVSQWLLYKLTCWDAEHISLHNSSNRQKVVEKIKTNDNNNNDLDHLLILSAGDRT